MSCGAAVLTAHGPMRRIIESNHSEVITNVHLEMFTSQTRPRRPLAFTRKTVASTRWSPRGTGKPS